MYIREDMAQITVTLDGVTYAPPESAAGSWATYDGGENEADDSKTRPGGMGKSKSAGGPAERGDITVTTQLSDLNWSWINKFDSRAGVGEVVVGVTYMDREKNIIAGSGFTRTGTLKTATPPAQDANGNAVGFFSVVVSADE